MANSITDIEKAFLAGYLGYSDAVMSTKTLSQLRTDFAAASIPKTASANTWAGDQTFGKVGFNNNAPVAKAAAIVTPTAPSAVYVQAEATAMKTAVDAIRVALQNIGITL